MQIKDFGRSISCNQLENLVLLIKLQSHTLKLQYAKEVEYSHFQQRTNENSKGPY